MTYSMLIDSLDFSYVGQRLKPGSPNFIIPPEVVVPPVEALRAWMLLFVDYSATKQIIGPAGEARNKETRHS